MASSSAGAAWLAVAYAHAVLVRFRGLNSRTRGAASAAMASNSTGAALPLVAIRPRRFGEVPRAELAAPLRCCPCHSFLQTALRIATRLELSERMRQVGQMACLLAVQLGQSLLSQGPRLLGEALPASGPSEPAPARGEVGIVEAPAVLCVQAQQLATSRKPAAAAPIH